MPSTPPLHDNRRVSALGGNSPVELVWQRQSVWSQAASAAKQNLVRARTVVLLLGIAAALFGTTAAQLMDPAENAGRIAAFAAALSGAAIPVAAVRCGPQAMNEWTRLRSVAESLKSEVYVSLSGAAPYRGPDVGTVLTERLTAVEHDAGDLAHHVQARTPRNRPLPDVRDLPTYIRKRINQQIEEYYEPQSRAMGRRVTLVRRAETALALVGAALGAVAAGFGVGAVSMWIAVAATVSASVTAHGLAARYAYQELEYARTALELRSLIARRNAASVTTGVPAAADEATRDDVFVSSCEHVISVQNDAWMVKWTTV